MGGTMLVYYKGNIPYKGTAGDKPAYNGTVRNARRRWWNALWCPAYDADLWRCEYCGVIHNPWTDGALHTKTYHERQAAAHVV